MAPRESGVQKKQKMSSDGGAMIRLRWSLCSSDCSIPSRVTSRWVITTIHNEQCLLRHSNVLLSTICLPLLWFDSELALFWKLLNLVPLNLWLPLSMKTSQSTRISPDPTTPHLLKEDFSTMMKSCPRPWSPPEMALQSIPFHDMLSWVLPFTNPSDYYWGSRGLRHPCHRSYHWLPERIGWFNSRLLKLSGTHLSLKPTNTSSILYVQLCSLAWIKKTQSSLFTFPF